MSFYGNQELTKQSKFNASVELFRGVSVFSCHKEMWVFSIYLQ